MAWVAGVRFKPAGKIYYFDCQDIDLEGHRMRNRSHRQAGNERGRVGSALKNRDT